MVNYWVKGQALDIAWTGVSQLFDPKVDVNFLIRSQMVYNEGPVGNSRLRLFKL